MNAILLTMPAVVYVAGISGAIHFANYYRDSVAESGVEGVPAASAQAFLAALHALGRHHGGRIDLAVHQRAGAHQDRLAFIRRPACWPRWGCCSCSCRPGCSLWPMRPHSLLDGDQPKAEDIALPARWRKFLQGVLNHHRWCWPGMVCLMVFCGIGLTKINTSIKLTKLFSSDAHIIHDYEWLEDNLGPLVPMEVVLKLDNTKCDLTFLERLRTGPPDPGRDAGHSRHRLHHVGHDVRPVAGSDRQNANRCATPSATR